MKSPMTQMLMLALAIVFSMALALTVALICLSYMREESAVAPPDRDTLFTTPELPVGNMTSYLLSDSSTTTLEPEPLPPEPLGNGLEYFSNGNGTCSVTGIGTCTDACVVIPEVSPAGDRVISVSSGAFYGLSGISAIQIPSGVASIGELAFANCSELVHISVSRQNAYYCDVDGILYTSDGSTLLLYPPMHAGSTVIISPLTIRIAEMAFYRSAYLTHVHYNGTPEQWELISIAPRNYALTAASKSFGGK